MAKGKDLSAKQLKVLEEIAPMYVGEEISGQPRSTSGAKDRPSRNKFRHWLDDESFQAELHKRIDWLKMKSELIIARYRTFAAAKLVELINDAEKEETARKACLDILNLSGPKPPRSRYTSGSGSGEIQEKEKQHPQGSTLAEEPSGGKLSQAKAGRILAILAEEEENEKK